MTISNYREIKLIGIIAPKEQVFKVLKKIDLKTVIPGTQE